MSIQRYQDNVIDIPSEREWQHMDRMATLYAKSAMCPAAFKGKPTELMVAAVSLRELDVPFTLNTLNQVFVIDGKMEMMAQLKVAIAARAGWDIWFVSEECDDRHAIVHYVSPGKPERTTEYTIEEARTGGMLDEWVEKQTRDGAWPDGNPRYRKTRFVVAVDGDPKTDLSPEVKQLLGDGTVKRKDPWFMHRGDMLRARAITKALRYEAPHLLLGVDSNPIAIPVETAPPMQYVPQSSRSAPAAISAARDPEPARPVDDVPLVGPPMVQAAPAKWELVDAYKEGGFDQETAIAAVAGLWENHGLDRDPVTRATLDGLLTLIRAEQIAVEDAAAGIGDNEEPQYADGEEPFD